MALPPASANRVGERREADVEHLQLFTEEFHVFASVVRRRRVCVFDEARSQAHGLGVAAREDHAGVAKRRLLRGEILRVPLRAANEADESQIAALLRRALSWRRRSPERSRQPDSMCEP